MTALEPDELLTEVRFPDTRGAAVAFREVARRHGDFAIGGLAAAIWFDGRGLVGRAGMAASGMGGGPIQLASAGRAIIGRALAGDAIEDAATEASNEVEPFSDAHADDGYRRTLIATLVRRALTDLAVRGRP
jgi:CO/xanthine dehydrogenase FAD-binding subunit